MERLLFAEQVMATDESQEEHSIGYCLVKS